MSKKSKILNFFKGSKSEAAPSETVEKKTVAQLQQEYSNLCARLGDNAYQTWLKQEEAKLLLNALRQVNQDGAEAQRREAEAAPEKAEGADAKPEQESNE